MKCKQHRHGIPKRRHVAGITSPVKVMTPVDKGNGVFVLPCGHRANGKEPQTCYSCEEEQRKASLLSSPKANRKWQR